MKISCPKCNASGTIPDHEIPESGRFINCPRCREGFTVNKLRSGKDTHLVDTCPSCSFSTFGDETFSLCPKCGIAVKTYIERQRNEQRLQHDQELLGKKFSNADSPSPQNDSIAAHVTDIIDTLHPVNLIGWGAAAVAVIALGFGLVGIVEYDSTGIVAQKIEQDEQVSGFYVFLRYGLIHWVTLIYAVSSLTVSMLFMKRLKIGLRAMSGLLWATIVLVPLSYIINFIYWVLAPIPHTLGGYFIEIVNCLFMGALVGIPLYLLERYIRGRSITAIVKL